MAATLRDVLAGWVEAGLLDEQQAVAIERHEVARLAASPSPAAPPAPPARIPLMTELVVYAGIVLTAVGGVLFATRVWQDLAWPARLAVGLSVMALGLLAGAGVGRIAEPGAARLRGVSWGIGTGGAALAAGVAVVWLADASPEATAVVVGLATAVVSVALWRNLARPLQLLTTLVGMAVAAIGLHNLLGTPDWVGLVGIPAGLALVAAALRDRVHPSGYAAAFGAVPAVLAPASLAGISMLATAVLGLVVAAGLIVLGARTGRIAVVVVTALIGWNYLTMLLSEYFTGPLGALALLVPGVLVLVGVVVWLRRHGPGRSGPASGARGAPQPG